MFTLSNTSLPRLSWTHRQEGVSLLAVVVMIGVLAVSLTVTRLLLYQQKDAHRESLTKKEMKEIYEAIIGSPEMGTFGYVGDMGAQPVSLNDLIANPNTFSNGFNEVKMGWNGPYINVGRDLESYKKDAWGNDYAVVGVSQIRSNGPDGIANTPDDIVFPPKPLNSVNGSLVLKVPKGGVLCNQSDINEVVIYYSEEGVEKSKSLETDFKLFDVDGFYVTDPIPLHHGVHAVKVGDIVGKTVFANVVVFAESTNTQIVGTLPYKGIHLHPLDPPRIHQDGDGKIIDIPIVNSTGCREGEGVSYNISRIDIAEIGVVKDQSLIEISFNDSVVFTAGTGITISHDIKNPTSINLSETYRLQPGKTLNKLEFRSAVSSNSAFLLTYHYTDTVEPEALKNSTISFGLK